ncbi:MAG: Fic family protein [Rickettsiales bacterium]|jgi:Fic family protein|nr:Fic family protein [Rickettsiales bacterium]
MNHFSQSVTIFHDRILPEDNAALVGYSALINAYELKIKLPEILSIIASKHKQYSQDCWNIYTPRHAPEDSLAGHLIFALKYEGIDLAVLNAIFKKISAQDIIHIVQNEPTGNYSRRIWFFYEWLTRKTLDIPDALSGNFVDALNPEEYYVCLPVLSKRHRVRNNLPGTYNFCPLVRKTAKIEEYIAKDLKTLAHKKTKAIHPDVITRASAFLLLKDSRASFAIEGERAGKNRAERWGKAIYRAGQSPLSKEELIRLQHIVIEDTRFVNMGFRTAGGFIGTHERMTNIPIPDHISARWQDIDILIDGLIETYNRLCESEMDPIIAATIIAFGFIFIHPFEDGNGRIHRYLIHHVLNESEFAPDGIIFPVSAAILNSIKEYKNILEHHAKPGLNLIEWRPTDNGNVEILNETIDLYRYFDVTKQAEFLYDCVYQTIEDILPEEVLFLERYDNMKNVINERFDMPDHIADLLIRFLAQNHGKLSKRAREIEFKELSEDEISKLEDSYQEIFDINSDN